MTRPAAPGLLGGAMGALTFGAYLPGLGRSLDFDSAETVGLFIRHGPPWAAFQRQVVYNNHPFFSFLEQLVRVVTERVDAGTLRVLPIAFGAATVGLLAWYGARRFGTLAGVVAGAVVAVNPTFVTLSRAVRGYSLLALCALVATIIVIDDVLPAPRLPRSFGRWSGAAYVVAVAVGVATHLFMVLIVVVHLAMLVGARRFDERWRLRFLVSALLSALAYSALARVMLDASGEHRTLFQSRLPVDVVEDVLGGGWAALLALPVAGVGVVLAARQRVARIGFAAFVVAFVLLWVVYRSSALTPRFFVLVAPVVGLAVALAIARVRPLAVAAALSGFVALLSIRDGYRDDPTSYRQAADVVHSVDAAGGRSCVVDVGVSPMSAYVDAPAEFAPITQTDQLSSCDVVVVAAWWNKDEDWFRADREIIAAAEQRFVHSLVLRSDDPTLVLSSAPWSRWNVSA